MPCDPSEVYHTLVEELRQADGWYRETSENSDRLAIASYAVCKVIDFLNADPIIREGLTAPLGALAAAACEAAQGGRPALLFECRASAHRPITDARLYAVSMAAFDVLLAAGHLREGAATIIADEFRAGGRSVSSELLLVWRQNLSHASAQTQEFLAELRAVVPTLLFPTTDPTLAIQRARRLIQIHLTTGM